MDDIYADLDDFNINEELQKTKLENESLRKEMQKVKEDNQNLKRTIELLEKKNNASMNNIANLYKTSNLEIQRKNEEIQNLQLKLNDVIFKRKIRTSFHSDSENFNNNLPLGTDIKPEMLPEIILSYNQIEESLGKRFRDKSPETPVKDKLENNEPDDYLLKCIKNMANETENPILTDQNMIQNNTVTYSKNLKRLMGNVCKKHKQDEQVTEIEATNLPSSITDLPIDPTEIEPVSVEIPVLDSEIPTLVNSVIEISINPTEDLIQTSSLIAPIAELPIVEPDLEPSRLSIDPVDTQIPTLVNSINQIPIDLIEMSVVESESEIPTSVTAYNMEMPTDFIEISTAVTEKETSTPASPVIDMSIELLEIPNVQSEIEIPFASEQTTEDLIFEKPTEGKRVTKKSTRKTKKKDDVQVSKPTSPSFTFKIQKGRKIIRK